MGAVVAAAPILLDAHDAVLVLLDHVAVDLDVGRVRDQDAGAVGPRADPIEAVPADGVVADRGLVADLVEDAGVGVVLPQVALLQRVDVVDVGPEARAPVVVLVVVPFDREFSKVTAEGFIEKVLLESIGDRQVSIGSRRQWMILAFGKILAIRPICA